MTADALSKPERSCARGQAREIRDQVHDDGGCAYCTNRSELFQSTGRRAACGLDPPRQFPACVSTAQGFVFDAAAYLDGAGKNPR